MARIDVLPSIEIIRGLKGILDFYLWKGLPCVRAWPKYRPARQTAASLAAALTFGAIVKAYATMGEIALQAYRDDAKNQPRSARDIYVSSQYGNLHEASMSDFLDALIIIRDAVVALTDLLHALDSVDTDEIVVNVDQSVLPPLAATTTNQATAIAALQKIDDLQDALQSVNLDALQVRAQDQLFSCKEAVIGRVNQGATGAIETVLGLQVPAATKWVISSVTTYNATRNVGVCFLTARKGATDSILNYVPSLVQNTSLNWSGWIVLDTTDRITSYFEGCVAGDLLRLSYTGFAFTLET